LTPGVPPVDQRGLGCVMVPINEDGTLNTDLPRMWLPLSDGADTGAEVAGFLNNFDGDALFDAVVIRPGG